jgi:hypothetical protein
MRTGRKGIHRNELVVGDRQFLKDTIGWGVTLWAIGYILGIIFFFVLPPSMIGWAIMPIGLLITLWVLFRYVNGDTSRYFAIVAVVWTVIAVAFDYVFIVMALSPADGYYKIDVYLYYLLTFATPLAVGWWKQH